MAFRSLNGALAAIALSFATLLAMPAWANLTILDPFARFGEGERNKAIRVLNNGTSAVQVKVSVINLRQQADGTFAEVTEPAPGERFADKMIRFSPSQFTLAPGAQQAIRLVVQMPADAVPGEYRTFLRVEEVGVGQSSSSGGIQVGLGFIHQLPIIVTRR